jgi:gamma-glutamylcyclotransferase (GGCT)/AIG2-like uncharacterized protein YtfP
VIAYLFVYGTLQHGYPHRMARALARQADYIGRASAPGRLYALRRYPALRPHLSPDDRVPGDLYHLRTPRPTLAFLDAYEDRQYRRILTRVTVADRVYKAWTYEWKTPLPHHRLRHAWPP